jgi:hypothetical protein
MLHHGNFIMLNLAKAKLLKSSSKHPKYHFIHKKVMKFHRVNHALTY